MNTLEQIDITLPDGTVERYRLSQKKMILGRGPGAQLIVAASELAAQHLLLVPKANGCWLSVSEDAPTPVIVNGQTFDTGLLRWGTIISIGRIKITLGQTKKSKTSSVHPLIFVAAALLLLFFAGAQFLRSGAISSGPHTPNAPPLFKTITTCQLRGEKTLARISELSAEADSKALRYSFDPSDGVEAVSLYQNAENCLEEIRINEAANLVRHKRQSFEKRLIEDYASSRARLEHHLKENEALEALREVSRLKQMLAQQTNDYTDWLDRLERSLRLRAVN
ncbi:MAG: hypothetical protein IPJ88_04315 [Myxococcales bacterium]|nr:MAG: hypothetical protein IPJ88_04315 [Myxococcales bacterium]